MEMTITANELKVKGVTIIDDIVNENESAIITVRGKEKYIVLKMEDYNKLREMELDVAIRESREDMAAGRFLKDGIEEHMKRVTND
jgi:PHD/YefM family antitoxin component YafN of YafNO toxin-antitoxin module